MPQPDWLASSRFLEVISGGLLTIASIIEAFYYAVSSPLVPMRLRVSLGKRLVVMVLKFFL